MQPRILVPFDFGPAAQLALDWAADLHRSVGGGSIKLVHVVNVMPTAAELRASALMPSEQEIEKLKTALRAVAAKLGPETQSELVMGTHLGTAVVEAARHWSAQLIVMGTHGRGALGRLVLGSVADHVMRNADCPVVTMRVAE